MNANEQRTTDNEPRTTLGIVAICHNEERDLPAFLDHLLPWVDEIVIVDDGSTDGTEDIVRAAGPKARLLFAPRRAGEYFSHQRNKGIAAATSDWLLHLDIDERVTPELAREILAAIQDEAKDGYRFRRRNFFLHRPMRGGGWQNWNLIHLARREKFRFGGKIHETCLLDAPEPRTGQLHAPMWHLNDDGYAERLRKSQVYCQIDAETLLERGAVLRWFHLVWRPLKVFLVKFLFQRGWRDGVPGLISAVHSADATFRTQALVWDEQNSLPRAALEEELQLQWQRAPLSLSSREASGERADGSQFQILNSQFSILNPPTNPLSPPAPCGEQKSRAQPPQPAA